MKPNHKAATIVDVAKAAEVSISTVSRVINDYVHVRPEIRQRVQEAMQEALSGQKTPDQAMKDAAKQIDPILPK